MSAVWASKTESDLKDLRKGGRPWGSTKDRPKPAKPYSTERLQELTLYFKIDSDGLTTITCPEIELAICGETEGQAWQAFIEAYNDLKDFLEEHEDSLSCELDGQLSILRSRPLFRFVREL